MPIKHVNEDGSEVELYTPEELKAVEDAKVAAETRVGALTNDLVNIKRGHQGEIKRLAELSEEEKGKLTEEQRQTMARLEKVEDDRKKDLENAKNRMFEAAAKGDAKTLEKLKEKYALVQMPESNVEEIAARLNSVATWAYAELGIVNNQPIAQVLPGGGEAPRTGEQGEKTFGETEQGKKVESALFGAALAEAGKTA